MNGNKKLDGKWGVKPKARRLKNFSVSEFIKSIYWMWWPVVFLVYAIGAHLSAQTAFQYTTFSSIHWKTMEPLASHFWMLGGNIYKYILTSVVCLYSSSDQLEYTKRKNSTQNIFVIKISGSILRKIKNFPKILKIYFESMVDHFQYEALNSGLR